jgi:hypothetical protein
MLYFVIRSAIIYVFYLGAYFKEKWKYYKHYRQGVTQSLTQEVTFCMSYSNTQGYKLVIVGFKVKHDCCYISIHLLLTYIFSKRMFILPSRCHLNRP